MQIADWLKMGVQKLDSAGIGTARLDALILLEDVMGRDRAWLLANPKTEILPKQTAKLEKLLNRRAGHEPLAYIRGKTEFYGREFVINQDVLEPRPESEAMIDLLKDLVDDEGLSPKKLLIADVGTGSGALGITAKLELPDSQVELLDIDSKALKVAKVNVDKFTLDVNITESDLLEKSSCDYNVLLCNLPYVPDEFQINLAASHEPKLAIYGGQDGLDVYRQLFLQLDERSYRPLYILCEALPPQHAELAQLAAKGGYILRKGQDFVQLFEHRK